jgi:hypothetical protein
MRGVFWNSNGFNDLKKHRFISELMKENNLSFIAMSEIGRSDFMSRTLKNLCGGRDFLWHNKAPHGRSGGILLGVDQQLFDIDSIDEGVLYVKIKICNKSDGFKLAQVAIYGPARKLIRKKIFLQSWCVCVAMKIFH